MQPLEHLATLLWPEANPKRSHLQRKRGARYLLQGLLVCTQCRYAYYGKAVSNQAAKGKQPDYAYYRLSELTHHFGGERVCDNLQLRTDKLDQYVWDEVCALLQEPKRLSHEYQRRLRPQMANNKVCKCSKPKSPAGANPLPA